MIIVDSSLHRVLGTILAFMHEDVSVQSLSHGCSRPSPTGCVGSLYTRARSLLVIGWTT